MSKKPDAETLKRIEKVSVATADPDSSLKTLLRLFDSPESVRRFLPHLSRVARLFGLSRFLGAFCTQYPDELVTALGLVRRPVTRDFLRVRARETLALEADTPEEEALKRIRHFKKSGLLLITLRDAEGHSDIIAAMDELSFLADVLVEEALSYSVAQAVKRYGEPPGGPSICIIGLGKLGGEELNYSSDIDIIAVFGDAEGKTDGTQNAAGVLTNRVEPPEFYTKVVETLNRLLSANTADGIAYRVDLRLRPQGSMGPLALSLSAYKTYYESWGRTWERMVMIRSRPIAGDRKLAEGFMETVRRFVWHGVSDYAEVDAIRAMKKKIDSTVSKADIKRGYGGIRECEFFIQTFQLIFGAKHAELRTYRLFNALQSLRWLKLAPERDLTVLWKNYLWLRRLEHYLQMRDDLQTQEVPQSDEEVRPLARKMGFLSGPEEFLSELKLRRMQVKSMYNTLLGSTADTHAEALSLIEGSFSGSELVGYLDFRGFRNPSTGAANLVSLKRNSAATKTSAERTVTRKVLPELLELALSAEAPDEALSGLEGFFARFNPSTAQLGGISESPHLKKGLIKLFSLSKLLSRLLLSTPGYLNQLIEDMPVRKSLRRMLVEAQRAESDQEGMEGLVRYRDREFIRLGVFYLSGVMEIEALQRALTHLADSVIDRAFQRAGVPDMVVLALGKPGGREMTYGSDLDLIFLSENPEAGAAAEKIIKSLAAYTQAGRLYEVDTRLRPDGSKGSLVKDLQGYRKYYLEAARPWELQALLRSRPVTGDRAQAVGFLQMALEVISKRGGELTIESVNAMRSTIVRELAGESDTEMDIKRGPGGLGDIEFFTQRLQLNNTGRLPELMVQNTPVALRRLRQLGILSLAEHETLRQAYIDLRNMETLLRLDEQGSLKRDSAFIESRARFMGGQSPEEFWIKLRRLRESVSEVISAHK